MTEKTKKWSKILAAVVLALLVYWAITVGKVKKNSLGLDGDRTTGVSLPAEREGRMPTTDKFSENIGAVPEIAQAPMETGLADTGSSFQLPDDRKIVKNGSLSMKVSEIDESVGKVADIAKSQGGLVYSVNIYSSGEKPIRLYGEKSMEEMPAAVQEDSNLPRSGVVTIKVPAEKFEDTIKQLKDIASQILSESSNTDDITEAYVDLDVQLKNKRAEEEAFVKILEKSGEIEDVLKVTREIARVRSEIERLDAQKRFYDNQTSLSQITISLSEDSKVGPVTQDWRPWQTVKDSARALIKNFQKTVDSLIYFVIAELPGILLTLLVVFVVWKAGKKIYEKIKSGRSS